MSRPYASLWQPQKIKKAVLSRFVMVDSLEEKIAAALSQIFDGHTRQLAESLSTLVQGRLLQVSYVEPGQLSTKDIKAAAANLYELRKTVALTTKMNGARTYRNLEEGLGGWVGYDNKGTPVVCLLGGIVQFPGPDKTLEYAPVVVTYGLSANGSEAARRPSDN